MISFLNAAADAFTDPNNPWYYVVGSLFLVLLIAAVVIYMVVSKKRQSKKSDSEAEESADEKKSDEIDNVIDEEKSDDTDKAAGEQAPTDTENAANEEKSDAADNAVNEEKSDNNEKAVGEQAPDDTDNAVNEQKSDAADNAVDEEKPDDTDNVADDQNTTDADKAVDAKKPVVADKQKAQKPAASKRAKKSFIDMVIAAKDVHGVYNEIKNTCLSYPGIKAKLNKDGEDFYFGTDKKAGMALNGGVIELYLDVQIEKMPSQFGAERAADGCSVMKVAEPGIDSAQRAIMFAMNVSMLTRNERHRHVDYVKKAVDAKQRAKKK